MKQHIRQNLLSVTLASILLMLMISTAHADLDGDEEIRCAKDGEVTFLFAHGLHGKPEEWHTFAKEVVKINPKYGIWRTQVDKLGHIAERGDQLAKFMHRAQKECNAPEKSVVAVGHSMGGLDLRYIVGNHKTYKKEIALLKGVYTIATPHLGDPNACTSEGGIHDLCGYPEDPDKKNVFGEHTPMYHFNKKYPHQDFVHRKIPFTAFYYECKEKEAGEDGVVLIDSQKWKGHKAHSEDRKKGFHKTGDCTKQHGCEPELCQEDEIKHIIKLQEKL